MIGKDLLDHEVGVFSVVLAAAYMVFATVYVTTSWVLYGFFPVV